MSRGKEWNKKEVIEVLKPYFKLGYSVNKSCEYAGIPQSTVQTWIANDEQLRLKISSLKSNVSVQARKNIVNEIKKGSVSLSKWWIERVEEIEPEKPSEDIFETSHKVHKLYLKLLKASHQQ
jgi:hypothetical protein